MFKLLTDEERVKVEGEYSRRRLIMILMTLSLVLLIGIIGLLPSYMMSNVRLDEAKGRVESLSEVRPNRSSDPEAWLNTINKKLRVLSPILDKDKPSLVIDKVIKERVEGITIESLTWLKDKEKIKVIAGGIAKDRKTLIAFRDKVGATGYFTGVVLPFSNLAEDEDINFQMELTPDLARFKEATTTTPR